nr:hypothetical protein Iba_chr02dCG3390 [Ipomoea batatas]
MKFAAGNPSAAAATAGSVATDFCRCVSVSPPLQHAAVRRAMRQRSTIRRSFSDRSSAWQQPVTFYLQRAVRRLKQIRSGQRRTRARSCRTERRRNLLPDRRRQPPAPSLQLTAGKVDPLLIHAPPLLIRAVHFRNKEHTGGSRYRHPRLLLPCVAERGNRTAQLRRSVALFKSEASAHVAAKHGDDELLPPLLCFSPPNEKKMEALVHHPHHQSFPLLPFAGGSVFHAINRDLHFGEGKKLLEYSTSESFKH